MSQKLKPSTRNFGYIDRRVLSTHKPFDVLDIGTNIKIDPMGKIALRDGYDARFDTRPTWAERTTPLATRTIRDDLATSAVLESAWIPLRRKCVCEGASGGTKYVFALECWAKGAAVALKLHRAAVDANGDPAWDGTVGYEVETHTSDGGAFTYTGNDAVAGNQLWIEGSMVMSADKSKLYVAVVLRDDSAATAGNNWSQLCVYQLDGIYNAGAFSGAGAPDTKTQLQLENVGAPVELVVDSDDCWTHDVDISIHESGALAGSPVVVAGYWSNTTPGYIIKIRRCNASVDSLYITPAAGDIIANNIYGITLELNTGGGSNLFSLSYVKDTGALEYIRLLNFNTGFLSATVPTDGAAVTITTTFYSQVSPRLWTTKPAMAVDAAGDVHFLYLLDSNDFVYAFYDISAGNVTLTDLTSLFDLASSYYTHVLFDYLCNWDFIVRGSGSTLCVFVYYVENDTTGYRIRRCQSIDGSAFAVASGYVHVSVQANTKNVMFVSCDRTILTTAPRRMTFFDINDLAGVYQVDFMGLNQDQDLSLSTIWLEALHEMMLPQVDGTTVKTLFGQFSDSRFRKRTSSSWHWEELENTMDLNNSAESWWQRLTPSLVNGGLALASTPNPTPKARFYDRDGVLRAGLGVGAGLTPIWYGLINRKFFDNSGTDNYADHYLDVSPLQSPKTMMVAPTTGDITILGVSRRNEVTTHNLANLVAGGVEATYNDPEAASPSPWFSGADYRYRPACHIRKGSRFDEENLDGVWAVLDFDTEFSPTLSVQDGDRQLNVKLRAFYVSVSFIYDGYQESQRFNWGGVIPNLAGVTGVDADGNDIYQALMRDLNDHLPVVGGLGVRTIHCALMGAFQRTANNILIMPYFGVKIKLPTWNSVAVGRLNPRITAARVWLGEIYSASQTIDQTFFKPAKTVVVSQKDAFKDEWERGERVWESISGNFTHGDGAGNEWPVVIDLDDILRMDASGNYEEINGHADDVFDSTFGLQRSAFPEAYHDVIEIGGKTILGGVRIDGADRPSRTLISAVRTTGISRVDTPDVFPDQLAIDHRFKVRALAKLDDRTVIIVGDTGIGVLDVFSREFKALQGNFGTDSADSVTDISVGREGIGFLFDGRFRLFEGLTDPKTISEQVSDDSAVGGIIGIVSTSDKTDCWAFYLGKHNRLVLIFRVSPYAATDIPVFIYDLLKEPKGWAQAWFLDAFKCGCVGVDDKLIWSDGANIFDYPVGTTDNGVAFNPDVRLPDIPAPDGQQISIERFSMKHKIDTPGGSFIATVIRDRDTSLNITHTMDDSSSITTDTRNLNAATGRAARREMSLRIQATQPSSFDIEEVAMEGLLVENKY